MFAQHELNDRQLRYFGMSLAMLLLAFAALAFWKWQSPTIAAALGLLALLLLAVYYGIRSARRPIYRGFRAITYPIQVAATVVILAVIYFGILTPIGLMLRLRGGGVRAEPENRDSYWTPRQESIEPSRYFDTY
jgi:hypothetical protein